MQAKKISSDNSQFPKRIRNLRESAQMTQVAFAKELGAARSMLAACESEENPRKPSASLLVSLGNVAAVNKLYADAVWFWRKSGVAVEGMIPAALSMLEESKLGAQVGKSTYIPYGLLTPGESEKPRILWDSRLLPNSYYAKYLFTGRYLLVFDSQETDLWKLAGNDVAVLRIAVAAERIETTRSELADYGLSKYPILEHARSDTPALYQGRIKTSPIENVTLVTLESQTAIGPASQVLAVEIEAERGVHGKVRIQVPYFTVLGRVVAWVDMRGNPLPAEAEPHASHEKKEKRRKHAAKPTAKKSNTREKRKR
jgi:transcriptional regulator with XRE-family HTH domain